MKNYKNAKEFMRLVRLFTVFRDKGERNAFYEPVTDNPETNVLPKCAPVRIRFIGPCLNIKINR